MKSVLFLYRLLPLAAAEASDDADEPRGNPGEARDGTAEARQHRETAQQR